VQFTGSSPPGGCYTAPKNKNGQEPLAPARSNFE
jgi:hypothetical protein